MRTSAVAKTWAAQDKRISLVVENKVEDIRLKSNSLGIAWYLFVPPLVLTCVLLLPQVRDLFLNAGLV